MVGLGVRVEIGAEDGHCGFVFLELFDELGFCMNLLECLVRRASDNCLGSEVDMWVHKRELVRGLERP